MMWPGLNRIAAVGVLALLLLASAAQAPLLAAPSAAAPRIDAALPGYIRVLLSEEGKSQFVGGRLQWLDGTTLLGTTDKATEVTLSGGKVRVRIDGKARDAQRLVAVPLEGYAVFDSRSFRGRFELFAGKGGGVVLLNVLPLEDYLCGVVPYEMPASWHAQALRAQAVAARTYAVSRLPGRKADTYDVVATVMDQVYRGVGGEAESTNTAVRETAGQVLLYDGTPITAMFCSDAGGCTLEGHHPYLQAVSSYNPDSKHNHWEYPLGVDSLLKLAREDGRDPGKPERVIAENDPVSGHLTSLKLLGSKGLWTIDGPDLRRRIGYSTLKSTRAMLYPAQSAGDPPPVPLCDTTGIAQKCFAPGFGPAPLPATQAADTATDVAGVAQQPQARQAKTTPAANPPAPGDALTTEISLSGTTGLVLVGSGYGHGVGMSQYGAAELAEQGWDYQDILLYFYRGVDLRALPAAWQTGESTGDYRTAPVEDEGSVSVDFYTPYSRN